MQELEGYLTHSSTLLPRVREIVTGYASVSSLVVPWQRAGMTERGGDGEPRNAVLARRHLRRA